MASRDVISTRKVSTKPALCRLRSSRPLVLLLLLCLRLSLAPVLADESNVGPAHAALNQQIEQALKRWAGDARPGGVVVVTRNGRIVAEHAVGFANLEHAVPITADSVFHVASDAKRFTAAAICRLAERGRLSLDDRVSKHIPEMRELGDRIRIEQLLSHTSGLRDQWSLLALAGWRREDLVTHDQVLSLILRQRSTNFAPGELQMYSNSGYTLLAEIVSRVSREPFARFVHREFFEPHGMSSTRLRGAVREVVTGRVESYVQADSGEYLRRPVQYEALGATALLTTARDLARWIDAVHAGKALSSFELKTMLKPRRLPDGTPLTYVFGLYEHEFHSRKAYGHGGADGGFRSYFLRIPEEQLGVIVLANTPEIEPNGLAHDIAEWALGIEPPEPESASPNGPEPPEFDTLVGSYGDKAGRVVTVRPWFDKLRVWEAGQETAEFSWSKDTAKFVDESGRVLSFRRNQCALRSEGQVWRGRYLAQPTPEQLQQYEGVYVSRELDASYTIVVESEALIARSTRGPEIVLTSSGRDFFDGSTWFCKEARFVRSADGRIRSLNLSSSRAFEVPFDKQ